MFFSTPFFCHHKKINQNLMKNLLDRFSSYLVGRGKKVSGHKILVESLFILREKNNKSKNMLNLALQEDVFKKTRNRLTGFAFFLRQQPKVLPSALPKANGNKTKSYFFTNNTKKNSSFLCKRQERAQLAKNFADNFITKSNRFSLKKTMIQKSVPTFPIDQHLISKNSIFEKLLSKSICQLCVDNVKPILETRKIRKGRITYRVPKISGVRRQEGKGIALLIENALSRRKSDSRRSTSFSSLPLAKNNTSKENNSSLELASKILPSFSIPEKTSLKISQKTKSSLLPLAKIKTNRNSKIKDIAAENINDKKKRLSIKKINSNNQYLFPEDNSFAQKKEKFYSIKYCLSEQFFESAYEKGEGVEKKKQLHQFALQNRANLHFRWW